MKTRVTRLPWAAAFRLTTPFLVMGVSLWLVTGLIDPKSLSSLPATAAALPLETLALAGVFCVLSLWAVARYDSLAHRHFETGVPEELTRTSGFAAIAIAQTVGFGVFTGAAARWRMLPDLGLRGALGLSTFVSVTFMTALAFFTALACILLPSDPRLTLPALGIVIALPAALACLSFAPVAAPIRHLVRIPSLLSVRAIIGWSGLDLIAAALALYILIPSEAVSFAVFLPVFLMALGAAMLSGAPGGVGPFELTLLSLLPQIPPEQLMIGVVAFRFLYYAVPAMLAVVVIFTIRGSDRKPNLPLLVPENANAELGILAQNGGAVKHYAKGALALWRTGQTTTMLFDPIAGHPADALNQLQAEARARHQLPCAYKCGPRTAVVARNRGWHVVRIANDCVVPLDTYDLGQPTRRGLRRKLRKAEKAGVTVAQKEVLPWPEMARLDAAWQARHGTARGGTMGRFCPRYLSTQEVFLAYRNGEIVAFASFHATATCLCLDLMRHGSDVPDGTMHLLVQTAMQQAQVTGRHEVSLAAVPDMPAWTARTGQLRKKFTNPGLAQFKLSFAPAHRPRYAAAPSRSALAIALADITAEVHRPAPLGASPEPHNQDEDYEVALNSAPWKGKIFSL